MFLSLFTLLIAMSSVQFGASLARGLFATLGPTGATTWRLGLAALLLLLAMRPWKKPLAPQQLTAVLRYGAALGVMNITFYLALARIPLGIAVALEFTGPLALSLFHSRRLSDVTWALLAALGLLLLVPWHGHSDLDPFGVLMALLAGAAWAFYIVYGQRASHLMEGPQASSLGMAVAALLALPIDFLDPSASLWHPEYLWVIAGVAFFSSALPYSLEMVALKRLPARTFGILMSLEPAIATLMGWLFLQEYLAPRDLLAIGCIVTASLGSTLAARNSHG